MPTTDGILADLRDQSGQRGDGVVEAEIIVGENKNELAFRQPEDFGDIRERVAGLGDDDVAVVALELAATARPFAHRPNCRAQ